ncbi:MAG: Na+/H+ antiporter subunit E [archaeon]
MLKSGTKKTSWGATFIFAFVLYLLLTAWSGSVGLWSTYELIAGIVFALLTALFVRLLFPKMGIQGYPLGIGKLLLLGIYLIGPFFLEMVKANIDVAYRVITGRINPGIVKIKPNLKTDLGKMLLANSITLTPGTLTVDIDEKSGDFYIHWINVKNTEPDCKQICGNFAKWIRRIAG